jgi:disulfide bond formation protein DsbB
MSLALGTSIPVNKPSSVARLMLVLALAVFAIGSAWYFELMLGYIPCKLCLQQRIPYYVGIPVAALGLLAVRIGLGPRTLQVAAILLVVIFAVSAGLGAYHAGVEWGFWAGPADCGGRASIGAATAGDLLNAMKTARVVSCTEASWRYLGLSFAGWNMAASLAMTFLAFGAARSR